VSVSALRDEDIVGERVLLGLQSVRISRLSTHPVPVAAGTFIAVAGQGPKDSNGAGKSSLLAQFSLLHGDEQWRFGSGAPAAVDLLFNSEDAGGEDRWGNADHGYIIGVFGPAAGTLDELQANALTVWIRIDRNNQKGPRLKLRWQDGLHLPAGQSDDEREQAADLAWEALSPRAGRQEVGARDLPQTLFGDHVRCASFLSTSVRAGAAPNLLAQPLNEITERRIFEAIAALTGIDHELEKERDARRHEYERQQEAGDAESDLARWEDNAKVIEDGIDARDLARERVAEAAGRWRSHTARLLYDGLVREAGIKSDIKQIDAKITQDDGLAQGLIAQVAALADDEAFEQRRKAVLEKFGEVSGRDRDLGEQIAALVQQIEETDGRLRNAREIARDADGRDEQAADQERADADGALEAAVKAVGVAEKELSDANARLRDVESGRDLARQQIDLLTAEKINAVCLLDAVILDDQQRSKWEPALWAYGEAVVVDTGDLDRAAAHVADVPGSILIAANRAEKPERAGLPDNADPRFDLSGFLAALDARTDFHTGPDRVYDDAGLVTIGGFPMPVIGRAARITAARESVRMRSEESRLAGENQGAAERQVAAAARRQKGARAAAEADGLEKKVNSLRSENDGAQRDRAELAPVLTAALAERDSVLILAGTRQTQIESLQRQKKAIDDTNKVRREKRSNLKDEEAQLGLPDLIARWDDPARSANEYLLALPEAQQTWSADDWWQEAKGLINTAISECFPPTASATMPTEIAGLLEESGQRGPAGSQRAQATFPALRHALHVYLRQQEGIDQYERQQIATQRKERHESLAAARMGHEEAVQAGRAHRGALASAIKKKLADVAAEFDRLDRTHGGYGASLQYEEPPPPSDPTEEWGWKVMPMWRRAEGRRHIPYNRRANTAQIDDRAIKLVCAAAAASGTGRPLVLVLDELGRNLGKQHRREAVALLGQIGKESGITVVGALQDDMEAYAIDACGEYIKLRRSSDSRAYNEQPVVVGHDEHAPRVELLRAWLTGNGYSESA
jgi:hypothetical protein